jgi:phosphotransferase system IIB component
MSKYSILAEAIVKAIGGEKNIASLTHCATRLRFELNDNNKADGAAVKQIEGVIDTIHKGNRLQVVIGSDVNEVYAQINKIWTPGEVTEREEKETFRQQLEIIKNQKENPRALQRAREENMLLKRKIKGMRDTQLEMDWQSDVNMDDDTSKLQEELRATQAKLKNAEKLAEQSNKLSRENLIHESAIDMLTEDMNALTKEKESLKEERDRLIKELSEIKEHFN